MHSNTKNTTFTLHLEGSEMPTIAAFYEQVNAQLMQSEEWKLAESLDAFDDLLYGGLGDWKDFPHKVIVWNNASRAAQSLGREITIQFYQKKIYDGSPFNQQLVREKIQALEEGKGQTYFEILIEIIESHYPTILFIRK